MLSQKVSSGSVFLLQFLICVFTICPTKSKLRLLLKNSITIITLSVCVFTYKGVQYGQDIRREKFMKRVTYTKEMIVDAGLNVIFEQDFKHLTARAIANELGCSPQPIYLQFENMDDLKDAIVAKLWQRCHNYMELKHKKDSRKMINYPLSFIRYALKKPNWYQSCFQDMSGNLKEINEKLKTYFMTEIFEFERNLTDKEQKFFFIEAFAYIHGLIGAVNSGRIRKDESQIAHRWENYLQDLAQRYPLSFEAQ